MKYYSLCHEAVEGGFTDGDVMFSPSFEGYYQVGKEYRLSGVKVSVLMDKKVKKLRSDFFLTTCGAFFVSEQLRLVLEDCNADIEFLSADVKYSNGGVPEKKYYFMHANKKIACFDFFDSEYSGKAMIERKVLSGGLAPEYKVRGITKFCVDQAKTESLDFMFVDGVVWVDPVVSELLMDKIKSERLVVRVAAIG